MRRRPFMLSALVVALRLALAASAAYTSPLRAAGNRSGILTQSVISYTFTMLITAAVVLGIALVPRLPWGRDPRKSRSSPWRALRTLCILAAVVALLAFI